MIITFTTARFACEVFRECRPRALHGVGREVDLKRRQDSLWNEDPESKQSLHSDGIVLDLLVLNCDPRNPNPSLVG